MHSLLKKFLPSMGSTAGEKVGRGLVTAVALAGMAVFASQADAGISRIGRSKTASEATQEQILEQVYGGDFVKSGDNYSNGTITATRVDDSLDQEWTADLTSVRALARFAKQKQSFGLETGASGGTFQELFDVTGSKFNVTGSADVSGEGSEYRVARAAGGANKPVYTSLDSDNTDGQDHLVTFKLSGDGVNGKFVLFFEDTAGKKSDFDYNDLVVEATTSGSSAVLIPLPAAAWSGLSGLLGLGVMAGFKKVRRHLS